MTDDSLRTTQASDNSGSDLGRADAADQSPDATDATLSEDYKHRSSKKRRRIRTSRLDYSCTDSSINKSEFRGFLNLFNICSAVFVISDPIIRRYETRRFFDPTLAQMMFDDVFLLLLLWLKSYLWSFTAYFAHREFARGKISRRTLHLIQVATQGIMLVYAVALCLYNDWSILPCGFVLIVTTIFFMKMHSFTESLLELHDLKAHLVCKHETLVDGEKRKEIMQRATTSPLKLAALRDSQLAEIRLRKLSDGVKKSTEQEDTMVTPALKGDETWRAVLEHDLDTNPSFRYYLYYLMCPVLVYEPHYPRGNPFRLSYFCRKLLEMLTEMVVLYFISVRYLIPIMRQSVHVSFARALLQLIWPMLICYVLVFFILFESICNLLAELTCFGDREFYHDWWNSTTWAEFSRKWNRPVHEFLLRHVYYQSLNRFNLSKSGASTATFFFSALLHELIMATCFKVIRFWMFGLMMLQIPLIKIGHHHEGTDAGNCIFWIGMMLGIPLLSVAYGREYAAQGIPA